MSENMYKAEGKLKVLKNYSTDKEKPNWYFVLNDMEDVEHRGYTSQNMSKLYKEFMALQGDEALLVSAKGETAVHKSGKNQGKNFISKATVNGWLDDLEPETTNEVQPKTNGQQHISNKIINQDNENDTSNTDLVQIYEGCWQAVNSSPVLKELSESDRKDISTSLFIFKTRRM